MSKREPDDKTIAEAKEEKPSDVINENVAIVVVARNEQSPSSIFKLHAIVCDDFFDYLSFEDLLSVGRTCKRFHRLVGLYFQENFRATCAVTQNYGVIVLPTNWLNATTIDVSDFSEYFETFHMKPSKLDGYHFVKSNGTSMKRIRMHGLITKEMIDCIKIRLDKLECIDFNGRMVDCEIYDGFLQFCSNLKYLRLKAYFGFNWLHHKYPQLEHVVLIYYFGKIDGMKRFLKQNTSLRRLECESQFLLQNQNAFMMANIKLDRLSIKCWDSDDLKSISVLLNDFHSKRIFKHLDISVVQNDQHFVDLLMKLPAISKLKIYGFGEYISWPAMPKLVELESSVLYQIPQSKTIVSSIDNVERVVFLEATFDYVLLVTSQLTKLKEIKIKQLNNDDAIDMLTLNKSREKLHGACKVGIYAPEEVYLTTKWMHGHQEFKFIEIKRIESFRDEYEIYSHWH